MAAPAPLPMSDHDLLVTINVKMDIYINQQKEFERDTRAELTKLWEQKGRQTDLSKAQSDIDHLDQVKAPKSEVKTMGERIRQLEIRAAWVAGALAVIEIFIEYLRRHP